MNHEQILSALNGRVVAVAERKYNMETRNFEPVVRHYRLVLENNVNWNWLTRSHEITGTKSLKAVQVENPAVQFGTHFISHANDFAYYFGMIDETHQISEREGDIVSEIDFYQPQKPHINHNSILETCIFCGEIEPEAELCKGADGPYHPACQAEISDISITAEEMFRLGYWVNRLTGLCPDQAQSHRFIVT